MVKNSSDNFRFCFWTMVSSSEVEFSEISLRSSDANRLVNPPRGRVNVFLRPKLLYRVLSRLMFGWLRFRQLLMN